jgi:hypothetical protein
MPILTINNKVFNYPDAGSQPGAGDSSIGYGEDATAWAEEVSSVLTSLLGSGDIIQTDATITNNTTSAADVTGLLFNNAVTRAANISYTILRATTSPVASLIETGTIYLTLNTVTLTWYISQTKSEDAGVNFSITALGQVQYTSTNMTGTGYTGTITFQARTLSQ